MAGKNYIQCCGPSYHLAERKAGVQSAINCYLQLLAEGARMMKSTPGEALVVNLGAEIRGSRNVDGRWFVAAGSVLYEMTAAGASTVRGELSSTAGFVGMSHNKTQLAIVDGRYLYIFNVDTNIFTEVEVDGWRGSDDVHELDGYFIFVDPGTDQFYISAIDDGTALDALDFSSADSSPDNIVTHRVSHRQLWLFGTRSTEIWIDSGELAFPFTRYNSYTLDVGCVGKRAAINSADTLFWIGQTDRGSGIVYMATGNQPQRVSTIAVEEALKTSTNISQASMWTYQIEGHEFIAINAPGLVTTWVYDAAVQQWHERAEWADEWQPLRSGLVTAYAGEHFAGDSAGNIVRLDAGLNTLSGRPLVRERTWPHMVQESMEPITFKGVELSMSTGNGGNVTLELSNDGGETFGPKLMRALGAAGRWMQRIRWLGLGTAYNRVFRIRCSDDVPFAIFSAAVDA
jgi:hypothetical protein